MSNSRAEGLTWALGGSEWQLHVTAALVPERKPPVLTEYEAGWATGPQRPWGPPILLCNRYRVFPGGKELQGCEAVPSPPSSAVVMNG